MQSSDFKKVFELLLKESDLADHGQIPREIALFRQTNAKRFFELELPHRKTETWRFTDITPLTRTSFSTRLSVHDDLISPQDISGFLYQNGDFTNWVFVNGRWSSRLSQDTSCFGVQVSDLHTAIQNSNGMFARHILNAENGTENVFSALNNALLQDGVYIHVPRGTKNASIVHVLFVTTDQEHPSAQHPHNIINVEDGAELTLIISFVHMGKATPHFSNVRTDFHIANNAKVTYVKVISDNNGGFHLDSSHVRIGASSSFDAFSATLSGKIVRNETHVQLKAENSTCSLNGLYLAADEQLVDNFCSIRHGAPSCQSWIGYKGVLQDKSRGVFLGKIHVERDAQKTDSKQLNNNLLLSDRAFVHTRPQLEIYADDVKCTHGATVGQPPDELVFYFRSRGISPETAKGILTYGFAKEAIDKVSCPAVQERLEKYILERFLGKTMGKEE
ncbi:MAG TPA: Fe-S cluster assembly protein SufD [Candidatus Hydrogenedentes bacterium]|nr:Fe-S cluster assembly protein SufD [Candidatus Hydrogenedentota bacterium]HOL77251.1 Fe-S cluster assembly protein SufD [Candidatus Hydrogenedentota bacterium]HPO86541.1 Fe-S cluster assembly protein SufD [Candidatus Hydrogenedentota bacterium]